MWKDVEGCLWIASTTLAAMSAGGVPVVTSCLTYSTAAVACVVRSGSVSGYSAGRFRFDSLMFVRTQAAHPCRAPRSRQTHRNCHLSTSIVMKSGKGRTQPYCPVAIFTRRFDVYGMPLDTPCSKTTLAARTSRAAATGV